MDVPRPFRRPCGDDDPAHRVPSAAAAPEMQRFLLEDVPACFAALDAVGDRLRGLPPGASLPAVEVQAVARALDVAIAAGERVLARSGSARPAGEVPVHFRSLVASRAAGNAILEHALAASAPLREHAELLDALHGPDPVYSGAGLGGLLDRYLRDRWRFVVRRTDHLTEHLGRLVRDAVADDRQLSVLALGAGPCREWVELDWDLGRPAERHRRVDLVCIHDDQAARAAAGARLGRNRLLRSIVFGDDVRDLAAESRRFDLVFAAGLADHLADGSLAHLVRTACGLLAPRGHLLLTHTDRDRTPLEVGEWLLGLVLVKRSAAEFAALLRRALRGVTGDPEVHVRHDPSGTTVFASIGHGEPVQP